MSMDDVLDGLKSDSDEMKKWVGVYIGLLAVLLAVCNVGGANAAKDATRANIEASNSWAFYQAKTIRRTAYTVAVSDLELQLAAQLGQSESARKAVEGRIRSYRAEADRLKKDPEDGMDQLMIKAKSLELERNIALRKDPYFDWSQAMLQIAIVLASVHLIVGNLLILGLSGGLAGLGILLMLNGFTLAVALPILG